MSSSLPAPGAVLLIDLQQAIDHPSWGQRNNPQAETQIALLALARPGLAGVARAP